MRTVGYVCIAGCAAIGLSAQAQTYPAKPITIINPFAAGGGGDIAGRTIGAVLSQALGQSVIIESRPGGGGSIGLQAVVDLVRKDGKAFGTDPRGGPWASVIKIDAAFAEHYAKLDVEHYKLIVERVGAEIMPSKEP